MRRLRTALLLLAVVTVLGGCAQEPAPEHVGAPSISYTEPPLPAAATMAPATGGTTSPAPGNDCGDPTASLRPFPDTEPPPPMPGVDEIRARGRLVVGLDTGSNLMSFRDPTSGAITGFDVDIAREVARDLFGDPDRIEYHVLTSADRQKALEKSSVDIVAKTMTITCDRREHVAFSSEYLEAQQRVLVVKGSPIRNAADLGGKRVCAARGTTSLMRLQQTVPTASILTVPMWSDCLVVLQQRQVDAVSTDDTILAGLVSQDPYLEIVGPGMGSEPYGIGITKTKDDLVRFVNGTLERIRRDGTWTRLYDRWLSMLGPAPAPPTAVYQD